MGDYLPSDATLNRFFALHVIALPLVLLLLVVLHLGALHEGGLEQPGWRGDQEGAEGQPLVAERPGRWHSVPPVLHALDGVGAGFLLIIAAFIIFFARFGGLFLEHDNFTEANRCTPEHIKPVWYYTPYYAMLRVVPNKLAACW
jgi:ubiquinol-cytochrome c reductase cytochrome b subunit